MALLDYVIVDLLSVVLVLVLPVFFILASIFIQLKAHCDSSAAVRPDGFKGETKLSNRARKIFLFQVKMLRHFYGSWVIDVDEDNGKFPTLLFGKPFPSWAVVMSTGVLAVMVCYITIMFINALLLRREYSCDLVRHEIGFECFQKNFENRYKYLSNPINCSEAEERDRIVCFKYTFNFPFAAGLAGGLLEFFPLLFTVPLFVIVKLASWTRFFKYVAFFLQLSMLLLILISCAMLFSTINGITHYIIGIDVYNYFTYVSLFAILLSVLVMPWSLAAAGNGYNNPPSNENDHIIQEAEKGNIP
jgi:hypothetical protein